jgi:hypothetical protein
MKQKILYSVLSLICFFALVKVTAQNEKKRYEHFKERSISKSYQAAGTTLDIDNSFGDVEVVTTAGNEIKVDVHIEASSSDADVAEKTYNSISVADDKKGSTVYFKTSVGNTNNKGCTNCHTSMSIDYTIHLPSSVKLNIKNSFGKILVPDYNGDIWLNSKFGSLTAGNLSSAKKLNVEFGVAKIKSIDNADAVFKFSTVELEALSGSNKLKLEFCNGVKVNLTSAITSLNLNESYSTVNLKPAGNLSATYSMHTSFGTLVNRSDITINRTDKPDEYGPDADKDYEGKSGNGNIKIDIKSSFGKIIIGEPKPGDIKEKSKNKPRNKNEAEI